MMDKVTKITISILILLFLYCCQNENDQPTLGKVDGAKLSDEKQIIYLSELKKAGIEYEITDRGFVKHNIEDTEQLRNIQREVIYGSKLDSNIYESVGYSGEDEKLLFITQFDKNGIPYILNVSNNYPETGYFNYSQVHGPKVDKIVQIIYTMRDK